MISNDIIRSLRYTLKTNNAGLVRLWALAEAVATPELIDAWVRKEDDAGFQEVPSRVHGLPL